MDEFFQTDDFLMESGTAPNRLVHFPVEIADLALQCERTMRLALAPADDMPSNDLTGLGDESQVRVPLGQFPCAVHALHEVGVPNVLIEMADAFVETDYLAQWNCALNSSWRSRTVVGMEDEAIQPSFARVSDDAERAFRLVSVFNNDVLEFLTQEVLDHGFVLAFDFDQVGENSERLPVLTTDVIKKLLNGLAAVRALHGKLADGLQTMANALLV